MYTPFSDLSGETFGKLKVIRLSYMRRTKNGRTESIWLCECECGNVTNVRRSNLTTGNTVSCGCYRAAQMKVGLCKGKGRYKGLSMEEHVLYNRWLGKRHSGSLCEEWHDFEKFCSFIKSLGFTSSDQLKRPDKSKPWCPENCIIVHQKL